MMIKGCNIFWGQKLANTCSFVGGRIIMQQEKISRAESSWMKLVNALQEAIHFYFIKFCIYWFSLSYEFFVHYTLRVKNLSKWHWCGTFGVSVSSAKGVSHQPIQNSALCFGVIGKTPGLIFRNNFVKKIFVCIGHRNNVLARCDLIFPLLRCQGVWNKTCTQLSLSQILFQNPNNYSLGDVQRFCYHSWCYSTAIFDQISNSSNVCLPQSRFWTATSLVIFYQFPFLKIENTT